MIETVQESMKEVKGKIEDISKKVALVGLQQRFLDGKLKNTDGENRGKNGISFTF